MSALKDKQWFKIQVDGVSTHTMANFRPRTLLGAETVHEKPRACNPAYTQATNHIVSPPWWMHTQEELRNTLRSSLVFTVDDEDIAKELLWGNSLAAFAHYCPLHAYQERPPVKQWRTAGAGTMWTTTARHKQDATCMWEITRGRTQYGSRLPEVKSTRGEWWHSGRQSPVHLLPSLP